MTLLKTDKCIEFTDNMVKLTDYGRLTSIYNYEVLFTE